MQTNADPTKNAVIIREFDIVNGSSIQRPFAEVDFKTSGGHDSYNSMQLSLARRIANGLTLNSQYTLGKSYGNTAGSNEALTAGNPFDYDYDIGYNAFDVRHTFNVSALYSLPIGAGHQLLGNASGFTQATARRLGRRRDRERAERPADRCARDAAGRGLHGRGGERVRQRGGRAHRDHQHARRRVVTQRAAAEPHSGCRSVSEERRCSG